VGHGADLVGSRNEQSRFAVTAPSWRHVKELLYEAAGLDAEPRARFLDEVCASDQELRAELEALLAVGDSLSAKFLEPPSSGKFGADSGGFDAAGLAAGQLFAQRFQLIRRLGEGGMGQVWLAEQIAPVRRSVALKLIKAGMYDETVVQRFQAERQSLAIMDHPAIAKVFDAGITPQGQPYFVMEYVPGLTITEYCDQKKLKIRERLELFIQACDGVQHAHQKAIIHRDLKPANILVIEVDDKPVPRIIDFGLAKAATAETAEQTLFTRFGQFMGTPGYMSPEQVDPNIRDIDTRTDVYSLGVILYVLLTGLQPFETKRHQRPALDEWLRQLREQEPPMPSSKLGADRGSAVETAASRNTEPQQLVSQLRGDLDWITMKALDRDRERRYGTPADLAGDLRRHLNDEPVLARPASAAYQLRKFMRRHRFTAAAGGAVGILAVVASAAGIIAVRKEHEAQYQAAQALQAQSRLLTEVALERLKDGDVAGAQGIILAVLRNRETAAPRTAAAISVFQEIRAADSRLATLSGHRDIVWSATYSPDGKRILSASKDGTGRIWDAVTGAPIAVLSAVGAQLKYAAYSPDGRRIVTASRDKTARIWDAFTGAPLLVLDGHSNYVQSANYSPDGARIVTGSQDKTARIWDAHTGAPLTVLSGHAGVIQSASYSPDGTRIVTASWDKTARIWDARTGAPLAVLVGHGDTVYSAAYSPDGTRIVTASQDKTARIWDAGTGTSLAVLSGDDAFYCARYSPDGARIVTASADKTARIWDARTAALLAVLSGHGANVESAGYSPDGTRIVTASVDQTIRIWNSHTRSLLAVLSGHSGDVEYAAYSPDGTRIVTASRDRSARIWDAHTGTLLVTLSGHGNVVQSAAFSPDGGRVVTSSQDRTARIWDAGTGASLAVLAGHENAVTEAGYSPDGTRIATAAQDKTARIWDARTGAQLGVLSGHDNAVVTARYSPDGTRIVTSSWDKTARIWDAHTNAQLTVLSGHDDSVLSALYSPDSARIVTASADKSARTWDARTGAPLAVLAGADVVESAAYSPDGARIVTASHDRTARIWDVHTGDQLAVLSGHGGVVNTAAFSPDGTRIVTSSADNTARVWDARVSAGLDAQIAWSASAEFDPLPEIERDRLGLPSDPRARKWPGDASACDQAAAAIYDPDRRAPGVVQASIGVDVANSACSREVANAAVARRIAYQMGRALLAKQDLRGARRQFEDAVSNDYLAARVDLADLLVDVSADMLDPRRAVALYEQAWRNGVSIAAFRLGHLYEFGLGAGAHHGGAAFPPSDSQAWQWYQKGADAGEPNALARLAEREDGTALAATDSSARNARLLQAFRLYAAAAERAQDESWPDDAWKHWRYRRASLARLLALEGMMQQVADAYRTTLERAIPRAPTWLERIDAKLHR
jgi:WD40 repeat protein/TPR repeat protein